MSSQSGSASDATVRSPKRIVVPIVIPIVIPIVAGIGNALLAVPMVRQLKRKIPNARITILARIEAFAEVFRRLEEVDETIVTGKGAKGVLNMIRASRSRRPDVYLVPFPSNRWQYSMLAFTSGAKRKILHGYPVGYFRAMHFLPSERVPAQRGVHDVVQNLRLLTKLGLDPDYDEAPTFALNENDRARADEILSNIGIGGSDDFLVIHAGSANTILAQAKRWPPRSYADLISRLTPLLSGDHTALSGRCKRRIVLVEGPDESGVANEILQHVKNPDMKTLHLSGPLGEAAAILARASFYIGSDSGLAHLAAAVGTRAVTIFAPADPDRVCPFNNRDLVVQAPTPCSPCFLYPWQTPYPKMLCREPMCITQVTVDAVLVKASAALEVHQH